MLQIGTNQIPIGSILRIDVTEPGDAVSLRVVAPQPGLPQRRQEEVGVFDGWSDEEDRVFLAEEVDEESSSDEESPEPGPPTPRRFARRRRWCLLGCDCERARGRLCFCERRRDNYCSEQCGCDPDKCRARRPRGMDDDE